MELIFELRDIWQAAETFWLHVSDTKVFAFHGSMGAGKTSFIHAICDKKQVSSTVSSPTFSIINEYGYPGGTIYHIDLYRLQDEEEAIRAGVEECLYSGDLCFVEWPQKAPGIFPPGTMQVYLHIMNDTTRKITCKSTV